jgi:hypothetical protein
MKKARAKKTRVKKTSGNVLATETPEKVSGWLIVSLFSMALLFVVSSSDASFEGTSAQLPDLFAPQKVVKVIDHMVANYSHFLSVNFLKPLAYDYSIYAENAVWVFKESGLAYALGIDRLVDGSMPNGQVAGASISEPETYSSGGLGIDNLYSLLIQ